MLQTHIKVMRLLTLLIFSFFSCTGYSQLASYDSLLVKVSTLDARTVGNDARLDWKVICLLEYARFDIQRSYNGVNYTTINTFEADKLRCRQPFDFTDANSSGKTFYRIRVGDLNGKFYHSKIVSVTGKEKGFEINSLTPSIITNHALLSISATSNQIGKSEVAIINSQGKIVKRLAINLSQGVTEVPILLSNLSKGNYVLTLFNSASQIKTTRFVKL